MPNLRKVLFGYSCIFVAGAFTFYFSKLYIYKNRYKILNSRERIHDAYVNVPESERSYLSHKKEYRDEVKKKILEKKKLRSLED